MRKILLITIFLSTFLFSQTQDKETLDSKLLQDLIESLKQNKEIDSIKDIIEEIENIFWIKGYYTDSFGEITDGNFIISKKIDGYFSDTIATNKKFRAQIQIQKWGRKKNKIDIDFVLYKYGNQPYKSDIFPKYRIKIKHNGKILKGNFSGFMNEVKIALNGSTTLKVHQIFLEGGNVSFRLKNYDSNSTFNFSINDIDNKLYKEILDKI